MALAELESALKQITCDSKRAFFRQEEQFLGVALIYINAEIVLLFF